MAFINNVKLQEIRGAARGGNEKAAMVLQALRKGSNQDDLDRLINSYYEIESSNPLEEDNPIMQEETFGGPEIAQASQEEVASDVVEEKETTPVNVEQPQEEIALEEQIEVKQPEQPMVEEQPAAYDITGALDKDLEGLLIENDVDDLSFDDFIKNKGADANKVKKDNAYFKAYDADGRTNYMNDKVLNYTNKFGGKKKDIERKYNDYAKALGMYSQGVNDMLDDEIELDMGKMGEAYNEFTKNESAMSSFGRHWDEEDNNNIMNALHELVAKYGKQNIVAMINNLGADNNSYKDYRNNQIDTEINRYTKDIEKLLK